MWVFFQLMFTISPIQKDFTHECNTLGFYADGDLITIAENSDLTVAKQISHLLRLTIFSEYLFLFKGTKVYFNMNFSSWQRAIAHH